MHTASANVASTVNTLPPAVTSGQVMVVLEPVPAVPMFPLTSDGNTDVTAVLEKITKLAPVPRSTGNWLKVWAPALVLKLHATVLVIGVFAGAAVLAAVVIVAV